jgi:hypothetical protein
MKTSQREAELYNAVTYSLEKLVTERESLINNGASEWAVVHRFAVYLEERFPDYDVDCEYNLNLKNPKRLKGKLIRPDVLVHRRNDHTKNKIAIEFRKKKRGKGNLEERLIEFQRVYDYQHAEYILIPSKVLGTDDFERVVIK